MTTESTMNSEADLQLLSPIFVTGYMHSGTTLVQKVLGRHDQVFVGGGETRHFSHLSQIKREYPDLYDEDTLRAYTTYLLHVVCNGYGRVNYGPENVDHETALASYGLTAEDIEKILDKARSNRDHAALLGIIYSYLTVKAGKRRWLDKSPDYMTILDEILAMYPSSKILILVRDPRDILASKWRRSQKRGSNYDPVLDTLAWRSAVRTGAMASRNDPDRVMSVRYEDLVTEPQQTVQLICDFLDLEFDDEILAVSWVNVSVSGLQGQGIGTGAVGKWRKTLPLEEAGVCQFLAKKEMVENNYLLENISSPLIVKSPIILSRSAGDFLGRFYKHWSGEGGGKMPNTLDYFRIRLRNLFKRKNTGA